ncbi:Solute carrier family 22 member 3 [Eufriesea mexicana]|uniref:Solute carrier family 22 member 3 n=1 Tax=Eufriesea mexicana TaxID=516756 RepID=A0A310SFC9_9HYME|nr:PREDICTED: solute carrier family 22 member 8-like [Eufriesea mexicana]OAD52318.1 Solute carrier family 22 member 3 [Eufriesea mexicana]
MNAEEVKVGCFQVVIVLLLGVNYVIVAMSHALPVFHNYTPKFYCQARNGTKRTYGCQELDNVTVATNETSGFKESSNLNLCLGEYQFVTEFGENSVVSEWGLICEKRYLMFLSPTVYYIGVLMGAWIAGLLADRIGRLPVQAICLYTQGTMAVALYVVQNYPTFLALRGLQGVFVQGLQNSTYILSLELFPAKARTFVALVMQIAWAIGLVLLAALSYVIPDWRILQLAVSVPTAITVLYIWMIPESPRWLLAKGKMTEADMAVERITKYNVCCTRSRRENVRTKANVLEDATPVKPERKSRVSCADLKKSKTDSEMKEEAANLLNSNTDTIQQKVRKTSLRAISENLESKLSKTELTPESTQRENGEIEKRNVPSSSKSHRKSKSISQPAGNQRLSMKNAYDTVELRTPIKKESSSKDEEKPCKKIKEKSSNVQTKEELLELFKSMLLKKYGIVMIYQWFTSSIACYVFMSFVPSFSVNRHITFALGGILEIATYVFLYFILSRYGRRLPLSAYQSITGAICIFLAAIIVLSNSTTAIDLAKTIILLFGRVAVMSTVSLTYLYTVEIFPTVVRGTCLGLCTVFAKIGNLCTPHVLLSGEHFPDSIPLIIIGMLCLGSGVLALILPETLNKVLPDTTEDSELMTVKRRETRNNENLNKENVPVIEDASQREILRAKLFSEDWVDAGNGILVNFTENKISE